MSKQPQPDPDNVAGFVVLNEHNQKIVGPLGIRTPDLWSYDGACDHRDLIAEEHCDGETDHLKVVAVTHTTD